MRLTVKSIVCKRLINKVWYFVLLGFREGRRISCCVSLIIGYDIDYILWKNC